MEKESSDDPAVNGRRGTRHRALYLGVAVSVVVLLLAVVAVGLVNRRHNRSAFIASRSATACSAVSAVERLPYGPIESCRVVGRDIHYFGEVDAYLYVLIETASGLACLRVDYRNTSAGRQFKSTAVEVSAPEAPALTNAERSRLDRDIRTRGGVQPGRWTVDYGDG